MDIASHMYDWAYRLERDWCWPRSIWAII